MTSVLVVHTKKYCDVAVNGQRIARYPDHERAYEAARLVRSSLAATGIIPWGLLPQPLRWMGAPYLDDEPDDLADAYDDGLGAVYSDPDPGL